MVRALHSRPSTLLAVHAMMQRGEHGPCDAARRSLTRGVSDRVHHGENVAQETLVNLLMIDSCWSPVWTELCTLLHK